MKHADAPESADTSWIGTVAPEDMTPDERERVQMVLLRRWLAMNHGKGPRVNPNAANTARRFDASGRRAKD